MGADACGRRAGSGATQAAGEDAKTRNKVEEAKPYAEPPFIGRAERVAHVFGKGGRGTQEFAGAALEG